MQTVLDPKNANLEFIAELFSTCGNYHKKHCAQFKRIRKKFCGGNPLFYIVSFCNFLEFPFLFQKPRRAP